MTALARCIPGDHIHISTDPWTEPFWQAAKEERLTAAECGACGTFRMPPSPFCPHCRSQETRWPDLPGTATVYSFSLCYKSPFPDVPDFPFIPAVVDLDGAPGARLVTNIIDIDPQDLRIGMKVEVFFNPINDGWKMPVFRPLAGA